MARKESNRCIGGSGPRDERNFISNHPYMRFSVMWALEIPSFMHCAEKGQRNCIVILDIAKRTIRTRLLAKVRMYASF
jgi:hypothetical protein